MISFSISESNSSTHLAFYSTESTAGMPDGTKIREEETQRDKKEKEREVERERKKNLEVKGCYEFVESSSVG